MVDGRWSMVDGRWSMVDGRWSMVDGRFADAKFAGWQLCVKLRNTNIRNYSTISKFFMSFLFTNYRQIYQQTDKLLEINEII
ncbi:MAG: hypothetical protein Q8919_04580 [Bacteroidota bacterium]|nr:hypothetical protein [Bacteroidota bacterium]